MVSVVKNSCFFFSSRRRHTRCGRDWSSDVCSSDLASDGPQAEAVSAEETPVWFQTWEETGLLKFTDKNGDGKIQYYDDSNPNFTATAQERGWNGNELYVNPDIMVLANPEIAGLPAWVIGLIAAGGIAAALSTAAGLLLAISSAVSHDVIKAFVNPEISEKNELLSARVVMTVAIAVATWLGLNPPGFAAQTVALAFGIAGASIFPAIMMGIFSKRVNNKGAVAGMLAGLISQLLYIFTYLGWFFIPETNMLANVPENWLFGISPLSFGAIAAMLNFITAFAVSHMTEDVPEDIKALIESVRSPHGAVAASADH